MHKLTVKPSGRWEYDRIFRVKDRSTKDYERLIYEDHSRPIPEDSSEEGIVIVKNGEGKLYLTIPENADRNVLYARDRMMFYIKERTGVTLPTGSAKGNAYELLIGDTGRAESEELSAASLPPKA